MKENGKNLLRKRGSPCTYFAKGLLVTVGRTILVSPMFFGLVSGIRHLVSNIDCESMQLMADI